MVTLNANNIIGLDLKEIDNLTKLFNVYNCYLSKNQKKDKYYEGNISLNDVNLGIALPDGLRKLEIGCAWGSKTVDVLAARSMFDGFVGVNGENIEILDRIAVDNNLISEYAKGCFPRMKK